MRARVIVADVPTEVLEPAAQLTRDVLVPAARELEGYRGYVALYDGSTGRTLAITLWEDERTEEASDEASRVRREESAKAVGATVISVDKYDVAVAEVT